MLVYSCSLPPVLLPHLRMTRFPLIAEALLGAHSTNSTSCIRATACTTLLVALGSHYGSFNSTPRTTPINPHRTDLVEARAFLLSRRNSYSTARSSWSSSQLVDVRSLVLQLRQPLSRSAGTASALTATLASQLFVAVYSLLRSQSVGSTISSHIGNISCTRNSGRRLSRGLRTLLGVGQTNQLLDCSNSARTQYRHNTIHTVTPHTHTYLPTRWVGSSTPLAPLAAFTQVLGFLQQVRRGSGLGVHQSRKLRDSVFFFSDSSYSTMGLFAFCSTFFHGLFSPSMASLPARSFSNYASRRNFSNQSLQATTVVDKSAHTPTTIDTGFRAQASLHHQPFRHPEHRQAHAAGRTITTSSVVDHYRRIDGLGTRSGILPPANPATPANYQTPAFQIKPGYSSLWRGYRRNFATQSPLRYFRQRRWTNYFSSLRNLSGSPVLYSMEFSLLAVLRASQFFATAADTLSAVMLGRTYVNGARLLSPTAQLYLGDCVQIVSDRRNVYFSNFSYFSFLKFKKKLLPKLLAHSGVSSAETFAGLSPTTILGFFTQRSLGGYDVPNYLEVDYLACSVFVLYLPVFFFEVDPVRLAMTPTYAMRLYNWKYTV